MAWYFLDSDRSDRAWATSLAVGLCIASALIAAPYDFDLGSKIDTYLTGKHSPITGNGSAFVDSGVAHNVDPRLIVAIAGQETSFGTNYGACPASGFNAWSWFWNGTPCTNSPFASYAEGIERVTKGIRRGYLDRGYTTIPLIAGRYCASGCGNWTGDVTTFYTAMGGDTSDLTFKSSLIDFEQFSGGSLFTGVQPPLQVDIATISGGQVLAGATNLPADQSVVYGTADFCAGCAAAITIAFSQPVSNFSVFVYNGQTITFTYTVQDNVGGMQTITLEPNLSSGQGTVFLPTKGLRQVVIYSQSWSDWDFLIDNLRYSKD